MKPLPVKVFPPETVKPLNCLAFQHFCDSVCHKMKMKFSFLMTEIKQQKLSKVNLLFKDDNKKGICVMNDKITTVSNFNKNTWS